MPVRTDSSEGKYASLGGPHTVIVANNEADGSYNINKSKVVPTNNSKKLSTGAVAYDPNKYFANEKKVWRQQFMEEFQRFLSSDVGDNEVLGAIVVEAFNSHRSIRVTGGNTAEFKNIAQLKEALKAIQEGNNKEYDIHQEDRFGLELAYALGVYTYDPLQQGLKLPAELEKIFKNEYGLSKTQVLKYCALIQCAYSKVDEAVLKAYTSALETGMDDPNFWEDKNAFQYRDCFLLAGEMLRQHLELKKLNKALDKLDDTRKNATDELKTSGKAVAASVRETLKDPLFKPSIASLQQMTKLVQGTTAVIKNPEAPKNLEQHIENTKAVYQQKWPKAHIIGGALLMVAGVALMGLAVTAAVSTFGTSLPLSGLAIAIGVNAMVVGATMAGILAGSALGPGASLVRDGVKTIKSPGYKIKSPGYKLFSAGKQVTKAAEKQSKKKEANSVVNLDIPIKSAKT